jgi:hypothetical protein
VSLADFEASAAGPTPGTSTKSRAKKRTDQSLEKKLLDMDKRFKKNLERETDQYIRNREEVIKQQE